MALRDEHRNPTGAQRARIAQEKSRRPNLLDFMESYDQMTNAMAAKDLSAMPPAFYDHVHDRVYIQLLDGNGNPSSKYKAEDAIDPDINNRNFRTVED